MSDEIKVGTLVRRKNGWDPRTGEVYRLYDRTLFDGSIIKMAEVEWNRRMLKAGEPNFTRIRVYSLERIPS